MKLRIKESEIATPEQTLKFIRLFGRDELENVRHKMGLKRIGPQDKLNELNDKIKKAPDDIAEEMIEEARDILGKTVPSMKKDIEVELTVRDDNYSKATQWQEAFVDLLDEQRLFQVLGVKEEYQAVDKSNYFKMQGAKPHTTRVSWTAAGGTKKS